MILKSHSSLILILVYSLCIDIGIGIETASENAQESEEIEIEIEVDDNDILNYDPPLELQEKLPYFLSGVDKENSPVWIFEFGKWDFRSLLEKGQEYEKSVENYTEQMLQRFSESPEEFGVDDYVLIVDLDGYDSRQFTSALGLQQILIMARQFVRANAGENSKVKHVIAVNSNYLFQTVYGIARPIIGQLANVIELHGTNSAKWIPRLLKKISKDQLPDWLGGSRLHQPIQIYG